MCVLSLSSMTNRSCRFLKRCLGGATLVIPDPHMSAVMVVVFVVVGGLVQDLLLLLLGLSQLLSDDRLGRPFFLAFLDPMVNLFLGL